MVRELRGSRAPYVEGLASGRKHSGAGSLYVSRLQST